MQSLSECRMAWGRWIWVYSKSLFFFTESEFFMLVALSVLIIHVETIMITSWGITYHQDWNIRSECLEHPDRRGFSAQPMLLHWKHSGGTGQLPRKYRLMRRWLAVRGLSAVRNGSDWWRLHWSAMQWERLSERRKMLEKTPWFQIIVIIQRWVSIVLNKFYLSCGYLKGRG